MRFDILKPQQPLDPRGISFDSMITLHQRAPTLRSCADQEDTVYHVRQIYPDACAMPVPMRVGSGDIFVLGILPDVHAPRDPDGEIAFVAFVHAVPECERDKKIVGRREQYSRSLWRVPVVTPQAGAVVHPVEIRATDLAEPSVVPAIVGVYRGHDGRDRLALRCEVGGIAMSIVFQNPDLQLVEGPPDPDMTILQITTD